MRRALASDVGVLWRVARATGTFPRGTWRVAARAAWAIAGDLGAAHYDACPREVPAPLAGGSRRVFGEAIGRRRCVVCSTDDVAHDGWIGVGGQPVCPDCSRAALGGALPYGRCVAAYRGRVGSPRRSLGDAYRAVVAFKERHTDWISLALPLARSLARCVEELCHGAAGSAPAGTGSRMLVPVPSYRGRRPHVQMLASLAAVRLPHVVLRLDVLAKVRDFTQKGLSRSERLAESSDAYVMRNAWGSAVLGRHVIVADDLMTTGATLEACARVLLAAGAAAVDGAAIVRVIRAPPERVVSIGARQLRLQLRELDGRGRAAVAPECGSLWVLFACSGRCPMTAVAGPYPLPTFDAVGYHRWMCRCGTSHLIRVRREWRGALRECVVVGVGERRPAEILIGIVQGSPRYL
jgi:predicted amidophosphoribosyltransferase